MVDPAQRIAWLSLVLAKSVSIEAAAARYGVTARSVRRWAWLNPISCRIGNGSRRISIPLCDILAVNERRALWALLDGDVSEVVTAAFEAHGVADALAAYAKKVGK